MIVTGLPYRYQSRDREDLDASINKNGQRIAEVRRLLKASPVPLSEDERSNLHAELASLLEANSVLTLKIRDCATPFLSAAGLVANLVNPLIREFETASRVLEGIRTKRFNDPAGLVGLVQYDSVTLMEAWVRRQEIKAILESIDEAIRAGGITLRTLLEELETRRNAGQLSVLLNLASPSARTHSISPANSFTNLLRLQCQAAFWLDEDLWGRLEENRYFLQMGSVHEDESAANFSLCIEGWSDPDLE